MVLQCAALCSRMNCKEIHHTLVTRQTFVLTQDYEWESEALNLTVPKTPSVADTGIWPLLLLSFSRHPQALHNCLSASVESGERLGEKDKPHAPSAWLRAHELTFIVWKWGSFYLVINTLFPPFLCWISQVISSICTGIKPTTMEILHSVEYQCTVINETLPLDTNSSFEFTKMILITVVATEKCGVLCHNLPACTMI